MKTLKEISKMNPLSYKVIDTQVRKCEIKTDTDKIEIIINGKSKFCIRRNAYKFGLAEK